MKTRSEICLKRLGEAYHTLMDTLKQQIKGFDQDYSNHRDDIVQLEIQGMKSLHFLTCGNTPQMNTRIAAWAIPSANGPAGKLLSSRAVTVKSISCFFLIRLN